MKRSMSQIGGMNYMLGMCEPGRIGIIFVVRVKSAEGTTLRRRPLAQGNHKSLARTGLIREKHPSVSGRLVIPSPPLR